MIADAPTRYEYDGKGPLSLAVLCADCSTVSFARNVCPGCGARTLLSLARILDRTEESEGSDFPPVLVAELIPELLELVRVAETYGEGA